MEITLQPAEPKKKRTFLLKKRIEDAQNYTKSKDLRSKTFISSQNDNRNFLSRLSTKPPNYQNQNKTENEENESKANKLKKSKSILMLEKKSTFTSYDIQGPQLKINKRFLSFLVKTGLVSTESIDVSNNGSTAIYYEWNRIEKNFFIPSSLRDNEERFYCHHKRNVIKPGETISFKFSFLSKVTGLFDEEWVLNCEPHLIDPLPKIKFSGQAIVNDIYVEWRYNIGKQLETCYIEKTIAEIVKDIVDNVRSPTPPLPDLENSEVCEKEFEEKNYKNRLWYSSIVVSFLRNMEKELYEELQLNEQEQYWDMNIDYIRKMIAEIKDEENKSFFERKFVDIYQLSRFRPFHKSPIFYYVKDMVGSLCKNIPDIANTTRKECDLWEYIFKEPVDLTEEEAKKKKDEEAKVKADWLKKSKKKKFTEEDEKKAIEDYNQKFEKKCSEFLLNQFNDFERKEEYISVLHELNREKRPDSLYFESLGKKKTLQDCDLDGKRVLLRVNLKLGQTEEAIAKKEEHESNIIHAEELKKLELERLEKEKIEEEKRKKRGRGIVKKKNKKEEEEALRMAEEKKKQEEERKKEVPFLDQDNLDDIIDSLKICLEKMAKLIILMISYDKPHGKYSQVHSVKFFEEFLQNKIEQNNILFSETTIIPDFLEKIELEEYPDNSILILENVFFQPEEVGFFEKEVLEEIHIVKVGFEEKLDYISKISEYAPLFVIEDKPDLFKNWTSLTALKPESCVLGLNSGKDLSVISYAMIVDKMPMVLIIGGDLTPFKLLAIDSVLNIVDEIWLVGKIGMYFRMYLERLDQFCGLRLDELKKKIIEKIYKNINDMNNLKLMPKSLNPDLKISKISIPCDVFYTDLSNENDKFELPEVESPEFIDFVKNRKIYHNFMKEQEIKDFEEKETELCLLEEQEKELKKKEKRMKEDQEEEYEEKNEEEPKKNTYIQEINNELVKETLETQPIENNLEETKEQPKELQKENQYFLDFGSFTQRKLIRSIKNCKKVVWIESLCPNDNENFNETNIEIAKYLCAYQEEKKNMIQKEMQTEGLHNFNEDRIVFTVGKNLEQKLNSFDLIDPADIKPTSPKDENEENKSQAFELIEKNEENKSEISGQGNTTQQKKNNIVLVSDFHAKDSDFICKIISGRYPYGMTLIEEWEIKEGSEQEENFSFLDDI